MTPSFITPYPQLSVSQRVQDRCRRGELSQAQLDDFRAFLLDVEVQLLRHPIIIYNAYTHWFQKGMATDEELR